ncbi:transglycosylase SLT domain-containing protein [Polynucleobacter sp. MWH-UH2A]|uniref:transglycosylase SLT domain-containing protein n=1 Tax=Polynucleobacter sp. MWH-UH2A TaxID=1855617 RepID=UPI001BFCF233|nr:transglycosylase SLT domain-containing protein [Polynucleobacter sp. MWH-UH2A]QWD63663.1 transglycosylase SLT domain-containing protein [Polynucleobacter sp. MWH-UH2A]
MSFSLANLQKIFTWLAIASLCFVSISSHAQSSRSLTSGDELWTGTYDQMLERGLIRVAVPYDRTIYINDKGTPRGLAVDMARVYESWANAKNAGQGKNKVVVKLIPVARADLFTALSSGKADIVIGNLGVHQSLPNSNEFLLNHAFRFNREVLISGPSSINVANIQDLSGQTVYGGPNINFDATLQPLNKDLKKAGKSPVNLVSPLGVLDDEDLLEIVDAGLIPFVIVADWKAKLWQPVYKQLEIHNDIYADDLGWVGSAVRASNADLNAELSEFYRTDIFNKALDAFHEQEYKDHAKGLKDPVEKSAWARFESMRLLFDKYGTEYKIDPLFIASLGFQETLLNQNLVSKVGAVGVMQLMPTTGNALGVGDIHLLEPNIHAGADYMNELITKYFPNINFTGNNRAIFAVASYNIGPNNVAKARDLAKQQGFDPDQWFGNVEFAAAEHMGYEPMVYVRNVYKYFISYELKLKKIQSIQP